MAECGHTEGSQFDRFVSVIAALRAPDGCPWDKEQTHQSLTKSMVEETYEAVEAIETHDIAGLREELGDVLLQVVLQAQIAADAGEFTIDDVAHDICEKMIRRHPHVFADSDFQTEKQLNDSWAEIKKAEKAESGSSATGLLDSVPTCGPALAQAQAVSKKMVRAGFEWEALDAVVEQFREEVAEFCAAEPKSAHAEEELGDILFTAVNLGRKQGIDAETALRRAVRKVRSRWSFMEDLAEDEGREIQTYNVEELETMWGKAKKREK